MEKITDTTHLLKLVADGITSHAAGLIENHLQQNETAAVDTTTAHELYPIVRPALEMLVIGLPSTSAWRHSLGMFLDFMNNETAVSDKEALENGSAAPKKRTRRK